MSKNLKISWTKRTQFYNQMLKSKLKDIQEVVKNENTRVEENYAQRFSSPFNCCATFVNQFIENEIEKLRGEKDARTN